MRASDEVEGGEDERQNDLDVLGDERQDVLVVPKSERLLGDLEVGRGDGEGDLLKEHLLDDDELIRLDDAQQLFDLRKEQELLRAVGNRPIMQDLLEELKKGQRRREERHKR